MTNPDVMEYWGNMLIQMARSQRQMETISDWLSNGIMDISTWPQMLSQITRLPDMSNGLEAPRQQWENVLGIMQDTVKSGLYPLGLVPLQTHVTLIEKYENLKLKVADLEETVQHLRLLLNDQKAPHEEMSHKFQELIKHQGGQFQELLESMGKILKAPDKPS